LGEDGLERFINLASRFVKRYRDHPSVEGVVLFGSQVVGAIDEQSDIDLLFVLSDSVLPKIEKVWKEGMGETPVRGLWYEWEVLDDEKLPTTQYYKIEEKTIDCLFATPQMIRNSVKGDKPSVFHSIFQEGIIIYDKNNTVTELSKEILLPLEDLLKHQKTKRYEAFKDLVRELERFLEQGDVSTAEIISVECVKVFLEFVFALEKKIAPQTPKRIMLDSRKHLSPEIVGRVERVLLTRDLSERLTLLKDLHYSIAFTP